MSTFLELVSSFDKFLGRAERLRSAASQEASSDEEEETSVKQEESPEYAAWSGDERRKTEDEEQSEELFEDKEGEELVDEKEGEEPREEKEGEEPHDEKEGEELFEEKEGEEPRDEKEEKEEAKSEATLEEDGYEMPHDDSGSDGYDEHAELLYYSDKNRKRTALEVQPWRLPLEPPWKIEKKGYTPRDIEDLRNESLAAHVANIPWQQRGPRPSSQSETWRGQRWRATGGPDGKGRWGNNGGRNREWWTGYYKAKRRGRSAEQRYLMAHPKP